MSVVSREGPGPGLTPEDIPSPRRDAKSEEFSIDADARTVEILTRRRSARNPKRRAWLVRRALVLADVVGLLAAFVTAEVAFDSTTGFSETAELALLLVTLPLWVVMAKLYRLYDHDEERTHHPTTDDLSGIFHLVTIGGWLLFIAVWMTGLAHPSLPKVIALWALSIALVMLARTCARAWCRGRLTYLQNTVIVGAGDVGQRVARKLLQHPEYGMNLVGFVDANPKPRHEGLDHVRVLGPPSELADIVRHLDIERVMIAFSAESPTETLATLRSLNDLDVQITVVPRLFELVSLGGKIDTLEGLPIVELPAARIARSSRVVKRTIDLAGASVGLVLATPLFVFIAWRIKRDSPGPILFRQTRLGLNQREFTTLKFRTMTPDSDSSAHRTYIRESMDPHAAPNASGLYKLERTDVITSVGRWLRKTSLDELPQLINVLRGEMSLVGPRPCIPYETENFRPHHFDRFLVPAGITGLWQVTARSHTTFGEALDMDVVYARGWSLGLDLRLLCRTPLQIISTKGST